MYSKYIVMIEPLGYIQFPDGTRQSTSTDLLPNNNTFTGDNILNGTTSFNGNTNFYNTIVSTGNSTFTSFYVKDVNQSKQTKIYQQGNICVLNNSNQSSNYYIQVYDVNNNMKRIIIDENGNITGINTITSTSI